MGDVAFSGRIKKVFVKDSNLITAALIVGLAIGYLLGGSKEVNVSIDIREERLALDP